MVSSPATTNRPARGAAQRAPWGTISREQVIDAAMRAVGSGDGADVSIRGLASDLGVAPMTIYHHIRDKDDLLDEVTDRLLAAVWRPAASAEDWQAWIEEAADRLRQLLVTQPAALHVYLSHPVVSPAAIARMNAMMEVLRGAAGGEDSARRAYGAIHTYTLGFAAVEASRARSRPSGDAVDDLAVELATYTTPEQFAHGLRYLLEGIYRDHGTAGGSHAC